MSRITGFPSHVHKWIHVGAICDLVCPNGKGCRPVIGSVTCAINNSTQNKIWRKDRIHCICVLCVLTLGTVKMAIVNRKKNV